MPPVRGNPSTELANRVGVGIVAAEWFGRLPVDLRTSLLGHYARSWSAGSITFDRMLNVVANPEHSEARRTITVLEELVREALGHPKSQLIIQDGSQRIPASTTSRAKRTQWPVLC
jgi:hypothetical protein